MPNDVTLQINHTKITSPTRIFHVSTHHKCVKILTTQGFYELCLPTRSMTPRLQWSDHKKLFQSIDYKGNFMGWTMADERTPTCILQWKVNDSPRLLTASPGENPFSGGVLNQEGDGLLWKHEDTSITQINQDQVIELVSQDDTWISSSAPTDQGFYLCTTKGSIYFVHHLERTISLIYPNAPISWEGVCVTPSHTYFWSQGIIMPYKAGQDITNIEESFIFPNSAPVDEVTYFPSSALVLAWGEEGCESISPGGAVPMHLSNTPVYGVIEHSQGTFLSWGHDVIESWTPSRSTSNWTRRHTKPIQDVFTSAAGVVVVSHANKDIVILNPQDGSTLATFAMDESPFGGQSIDEHHFFVYSEHCIHLFTLEQ